MTVGGRPLFTHLQISRIEAVLPGNALFADLYEFTMLRAYFELGMTERATFSLFVRKLPSRRNFLIACGLGDLLDAIQSLRFEPEQLRFLGSLGPFPESFLDWLRGFRFTGDIDAMREGTPFFANEPILEVTAPIAEAQLIETLVLNQIGLQTILASKAARIVLAARGRAVVDFGARRAQGLDAATKGARALFIGGVAATSNVAAAKAYGVPVAGTVAHSFIEACSSETEAFDAFTKVFPDTTLLVDTYDTLAGVKKAIALAQRRGDDLKLRAIRLDSGDLDQLARSARRMLDQAGLNGVKIMASGGLDEDAIDKLTSRNAPIDMFGVGAEMAASGDAPTLDMAYKLAEYAGVGRMKLSAGKANLPGRKQAFRQFRNGKAIGDVIGRHDESLPGVPLLRPVMAAGRCIAGEAFDLAQVRAHASEAIGALPATCLLLAPAPYEVTISPKLTRYERETRTRLTAAH
ncbi:MAG: nicotinate phosphoribosyltransferase [Methylocystis sp.]|nr:nicotinate phosphoribosyltransferase [Methylocystis sp.]